jgi:tRNA (cmo5U34)-methyltransferase
MPAWRARKGPLGSLPFMDQQADTNAAIWQSGEIVQTWVAESDQRERSRRPQRELMAALLPFGDQDAFTFLDLGSGTGAASRVILRLYPRSTAVLADFSAEMMKAGEHEMQPFAGRYRFVESDLSASSWRTAVPAALDAVVTSLCVHHLPDERKRDLFTEIFGHLAPGGWYLNYDPVLAEDPVTETAWQRVNDRQDPGAVGQRLNRTPEQQARYENHIRYIMPLGQQLEYLRAAGFTGIDVYWKHLDYVIYGGCRPG